MNRNTKRQSKLERDITKYGPALFDHYLHYADPSSDLGVWQKLQRQIAKRNQEKS